MKKIINKAINLFGLRLIENKKDKNINSLYKLEEKHIKNLKVVVDRKELLRKLPKNGTVAELGVNEGSFSQFIISITNPKKLYLIDLWDSKRYNDDKKNNVKKRFENEIIKKKVEIIVGESVKVISSFEDNYFDWIYIDTSHTYEQTKKELLMGKEKVKEGGLIGGHDYSQGNIKKGFRYGVIAAVNEFCLENDWEFVFLTFESGGGYSFTIRENKE